MSHQYQLDLLMYLFKTLDSTSQIFEKKRFLSQRDFQSFNSSKFFTFDYTQNISMIVRRIRRKKKYAKLRIASHCLKKDRIRLSNRMDHNYHISNKKCLFYNIRQFCEFTNEDPF